MAFGMKDNPTLKWGCIALLILITLVVLAAGLVIYKHLPSGF